MVDLQELGEMETSVTRHDRIKFRINTLWPVRNQLTTWECDFVTSVREQFFQQRDLTDKQYRTLLSVWQSAHFENLVKLPKGMV